MNNFAAKTMYNREFVGNHSASMRCEQLFRGSTIKSSDKTANKRNGCKGNGPNFLLLVQIALLLFGILGNVLLLFLFVGRHKLNTASFVYIRIIAVWELVFFFIPYPLSLLTEVDTIGDTWLSANFLPAFLGGWYLATIFMIFCFAIRLQLIINYLRRSRTWNSYSWIAWRKVFWIVPISTIVNVSLCFEWQVDNYSCQFAKSPSTPKLHHDELYFGIARLSEFARNDWIKLTLIKMAPTITFWLLFLSLLAFLFNQQRLRHQLNSPITAKHAPLFRNLRPFLIAHVLAQACAHVPKTVAFVRMQPLPEHIALLLHGTSFALPAFLMLALSSSLRRHFRLIINRCVEQKRRCPSSGDLANGAFGGRPLSGVPFCSRLESENSEVDDRHFGGKNSAIRAALRADAVHRVRFAMPSPSQLPSVIQEEDEGSDSEENTVIAQRIENGRLKLPVEKEWPSTHDEVV